MSIDRRDFLQALASGVLISGRCRQLDYTRSLRLTLKRNLLDVESASE